MSRDYAKRNFSRKKSKKSSLYLWLTLLLLFAAFIIGLLKIDKYKHLYYELTKINLVQKLTKAEQQIPKVAATITKTVTTPKLDFYSILPQKKDSKSAVVYELEIAIVDDFASADRLKAELALLGFAASIIPIYQHNIQKYRLSTGPYDSKENANSDQQKLKLNKVKSVLRKVR